MIECPDCSSTEVLYRGMVFPFRRHWLCTQCGIEWLEKIAEITAWLFLVIGVTICVVFISIMIIGFDYLQNWWVQDDRGASLIPFAAIIVIILGIRMMVSGVLILRGKSGSLEKYCTPKG